MSDDKEGDDTICDCDCRQQCAHCSYSCCPACDDDVLRVTDGDLACEVCAEKIIHDNQEEIAALVASIAITGPVAFYDPDFRYAPTREEYEMGSREAYTANSVRAFNRHNQTNYDELIRGLDPGDALHNVAYSAVRERVEELLEVAEQDAVLKATLAGVPS